jgi:hypothetical protein
MEALVERYLELGLALGRHIDGLVDAYYGPPELARRVAAEPVRPAASLDDTARRLLADLDADDGLEVTRCRWLAAQVRGLRTTARKLAGAHLSYTDEVEASYGVRPERVDEEMFAAAHRELDEALPGTGDLRDRFIAWREAHAVPVDKLGPAIDSLAEELRDRTTSLFGLPDGEHVEF